MRYRLRSYDQSPPGGYCYGPDGGFARRCRPVIEDIARELSAYRTGNGLPRASIQECLMDADSAQCQRLGNNPTYCIPCGQVKSAAHPELPAQTVALQANAPLIAPPCQGCGVVIQ